MYCHPTYDRQGILAVSRRSEITWIYKVILEGPASVVFEKSAVVRTVAPCFAAKQVAEREH